MKLAAADFLRETHVVDSTPNVNRFRGLVSCISSRFLKSVAQETNAINLTVVGSVSDFFVAPLLSCIGDINVLVNVVDELAVSERPRSGQCHLKLPVEFRRSEKVNVYELVCSRFPAHVFVRSVGVLTRCPRDGFFEFVLNGNTVNNFVGCPAKLQVDRSTSISDDCSYGELTRRTVRSVDATKSIRCLDWPRQAAGWPSRTKEYGWPDAATVEKVLSEGCDVVAETHGEYADVQWFSEHMWRLTFSRAETVLLNSLLATQQIVYHVLRYVVKKYCTVHPSKAPIISSYHVKTIMLWATEHRSQQWWASQSSLEITSQLLSTLADCLTTGNCQHYFIADCNLIDPRLFVGSSFTAEDACAIVISLGDADCLSKRLLDDYVGDCVHRWSGLEALLLENEVMGGSSTTRHDTPVKSLVGWRSCVADSSSFASLLRLLGSLEAMENAQCFNVVDKCMFMREIRRVDTILPDFFVALSLLNCTQQLRNCRSLAGMEALLSDCARPDTMSCHQSWSPLTGNNWSDFEIRRVVHRLMSRLRKNGENNSSDKLVQIELVKAFMYSYLERVPSDRSQSTYGKIFDVPMHVYLASLHYRTGQYLTTVDQCVLVTESASQNQPDTPSAVVESTLIEDNHDLNNSSGLIVLYQYLRMVASTRDNVAREVSVYTAELFAFNLLVGSLTYTEPSSVKNAFRGYKNRVKTSATLFVGDILMCWFTRCNVGEHDKSLRTPPQAKCFERTVSITKRRPRSNRFSARRLQCLTMQSAVERLAAVRRVMSTRYSSLTSAFVTNDYEAIYSFRCAEYERCVDLCRKNIRTLSDDRRAFVATLHVPSSNLLLLMDDRFQSLIGLLSVLGGIPNEHPANAVSQLTVSLYLLLQCQLRLQSTTVTDRRFLVSVISSVQCPVENITDRLILTFIYRQAHRKWKADNGTVAE